MRIIVAIEPAIFVVDTLVLLQEDLSEPMRQLGAEVRWTPADQIRLVLETYREVDPGLVPRLRDVLAVIARSTPSFVMRTASTRLLPSEQVPRVLMVGTSEGRERLQQLRAQLVAAGEALGLSSPRAEYEPGIVVGRMRSGVDVPDLRGVVNAYRQTDYGESRCRELVMLSSSLRGERAEVRVLQRFELGVGR